MKQKGAVPVIVIVVIVAMIAGVGGWLLFTQGGTGSTGASRDSATQGSGEEEKSSGTNSSFSMLRSKGTPFTCTMERPSVVPGKTDALTIYYEDETKYGVYMELNLPEIGLEKTNVTRDGTYVYSWTDGNLYYADGTAHGYRFRLDDPEGRGETYDLAQYLTPADSELASCKPWRVDPSKFVPPASIKIIDGAAALEAQTEFMESGDVCSACNEIPEEAFRTQCLEMNQCI